MVTWRIAMEEDTSQHQIVPMTSSKEVVEALNTRLIDQVWQATFWVGTIALPLSVFRITITGWQPVYVIQAMVWLLVGVMLRFRDHIPTQAKLLGLVISYGALGVWGLYAFGVMGFGIWFFAGAVLVVGVVHSIRTALFLWALMVCCIALAAFGHLSGYLHTKVDPTLYVRSWSPWAMLVVTAIILPAVMLLCFRAYQRTLFGLMQTLEQQRDLIAQQAYYDELTALPTRKLAYDRIKVAFRRADRNDGVVALCYLDLNRFKQVNDAHGHRVGDYVLVEVAKRLQDNLRGDDTIARLGGDEFLLVLNDVAHQQFVEGFIEKISNIISAPIEWEGQDLFVGVSVGVAYYPNDGDECEALIDLADRSMYAVKPVRA